MKLTTEHEALLQDIKISNSATVELLGEIADQEIKKIVQDIIDKFIMFIKGNVGSDLDMTLTMEDTKRIAFSNNYDIHLRTSDFKKMLRFAKYKLEKIGRGKVLDTNDLGGSIVEFYHKGYDYGKMYKAFPVFSQHFRIATGQLNIIHGIPGHGKSEFADMLFLLMVQEHNSKICYYSPENFPHELHVEKILSKLIKKPFHPNQYTERMTSDEMIEGLAYMSDKYCFIEPYEDDLSLDAILSLFKRSIKKGFDTFVIDPWNEIDHIKNKGQSDHEYIGEALRKCRKFAKQYSVNLFIIAHPNKIQKDKITGVRGVPTPYDISGSSHWFNKAENIMCIYRQEHCVEVHIQKIKQKMYGKVGVVNFVYDVPTGVYEELKEQN